MKPFNSTVYLIVSGFFLFPLFSLADSIPQEAHIYRTGEVHLIGGRLERRHALNLLMVNVWGYQWKVFVDYDAKIQSADGQPLDPEKILVDHSLEIKGFPAKRETGLIEAILIRDLSVSGSGAILPIASSSPIVSMLTVVQPTPAAVSSGVPAIAGASKKLLTANLYLGMRGEEVKILQEFLQKNKFGIPDDGPVTGYFGKVTEAAVKKFQIANNLEPVGFVGQKTRALINELLQK